MEEVTVGMVIWSIACFAVGYLARYIQKWQGFKK